MWQIEALTMQNWNGCDKLGTEQTITLIDIRDNNRYTVAKLKDGECWMTQNLKLQNKTLTASDSDLADGSFIVPTSSINWGEKNYNYSAKTFYYNDILGNYYNWFTATAGSGGSPTSEYNAPNSICPKNWKLPSKSEADALVGAYTSNNLIESSPANFKATGNFYWSGNAPLNCGDSLNIGRYWIAAASTNNYCLNDGGGYCPHNICFGTCSTTTYQPHVSSNQAYLGAPIRCLSR